MSTPRSAGTPDVVHALKASERNQLREWLADSGQILWSKARGPGKVFALPDEKRQT